MKLKAYRSQPAWKPYIGLGFALGMYGVLAFSGIGFGLPHGQRLLSYNCDETTWLEALSRIKPGHVNPSPELVTPTFYLEVYGAAVLAGRLTGYIPRSADKEWFRAHPEMFARVYRVGRYLQVLCGGALLIAVWLVARTVFSPFAGNVAVLLLSVTPSLVAASHFSQASLPVTLLAFLSLGCLMLDHHFQPRHDGWLLAGASFCGLAISTKYSALPMLLPVAYQAFQHRATGRLWLGAGLAVAAGLFIGTPFAFIDPRSFWIGFQVLAHDNLEPITGWISKIVTPFRYPFRFALGGFLETACAAAVLAHLKTRGAARLLVLWIGVFFLGVLATGDIASPARVLIVIPSLIVLVGALFSEGWKRGLPRRLLYGGVLALFLMTLLPSLAIVTLRNQPAIQDRASDWIQKNIPPGRSIGVPRTIYWWTPDVVYISASHPERLKTPYRIEDLKFSKALADQTRPAYILLSEMERGGCFRWPMYAAHCAEFLSWIDRGADYVVLQKFPREVHWNGWRWNRPESYLIPDDDLWQTSLTLYQRKSDGD